jgi:hypothetical protein
VPVTALQYFILQYRRSRPFIVFIEDARDELLRFLVTGAQLV